MPTPTQKAVHTNADAEEARDDDEQRVRRAEREDGGGDGGH